MKSRKPLILSQKVENSQAELQLFISKDILDFEGHFPQFALLPGVTQIDWAIYYGQSLLNAGSHFKGMDVVKFQEPIIPDSEVTLNLHWQADKEKLVFSFLSEKGIHSSGKIILALASSGTDNG